MKSNSNPSTVSAENERQSHQTFGASLYKTLQQKIGTITEVHPTLPMVKVGFINGPIAAGGAFLPVSHSVLDIVHRFGTLRPGLRVMVTYSGDLESAATVEVIGVEGERLGSEIQQDNEVKTPLYSIFTPGSGF